MDNTTFTQPQKLAPVIQSEKEKHNKGSIIGLFAGIFIGLAGVAFGVYGMTRSTGEPATDPGQSSDNTAEVKEIKYGFQADNFIGDIEYTMSDGPDNIINVKHGMTVSSSNYSYGGSYVLYADGTLSAFSFREPFGESKDITSLIGGKPIDLAVGQIGNGGDSWLIVLLDDGRVVTIDEYTHSQVHIVEGAENMVRVFGNYTDAFSCLGYAQDKEGKIHTIFRSNTDGTDSDWSFKIR